MPRLKTLQPRFKVMGSIVEEKLKASRTGRNADSRRTIPLNSSRWQRLRDVVLSQEPLCRDCHERGLTVPATDVDHVSGDPSDNRPVNLQPLCHSCHSLKTAADHGKRVNQGCDVDGLPAAWKKSPATDGARPHLQSPFNADCKGRP